MKSLLVVVTLVAAATAANVDWLNLRPIAPPAIMSNLPAWKKVDGRIAGGQEVTPHQIPFQVRLLN